MAQQWRTSNMSRTVSDLLEDPVGCTTTNDVRRQQTVQQATQVQCDTTHRHGQQASHIRLREGGWCSLEMSTRHPNTRGSQSAAVLRRRHAADHTNVAACHIRSLRFQGICKLDARGTAVKRGTSNPCTTTRTRKETPTARTSSHSVLIQTMRRKPVPTPGW